MYFHSMDLKAESVRHPYRLALFGQIYLIDGNNNKMTTWFVSRHPGAIAWIKSQSVTIDCFVEHLDVDQISSGDTVIGNVPLHLAAQICTKGARLICLSVSVPSALRGHELTKEVLTQLKCTLQEFHVEPVG